MTARENSNEKSKELTVSAEPSRVIPKLATKVAVASATDGGNIIVSFIAGLPGEQAHLIERVVLDKALALELMRQLTQATSPKDITDA